MQAENTENIKPNNYRVTRNYKVHQLTNSKALSQLVRFKTVSHVAQALGFQVHVVRTGSEVAFVAFVTYDDACSWTVRAGAFRVRYHWRF